MNENTIRLLVNNDIPNLLHRLEEISESLKALVELKKEEMQYQKRQAGYESMGHGD